MLRDRNTENVDYGVLTRSILSQWSMVTKHAMDNLLFRTENC